MPSEDDWLVHCLEVATAKTGRMQALIDELIAYSHLRDKVRLREDLSEYVEAERLIARADALRDTA